MNRVSELLKYVKKLPEIPTVDPADLFAAMTQTTRVEAWGVLKHLDFDQSVNVMKRARALVLTCRRDAALLGGLVQARNDGLASLPASVITMAAHLPCAEDGLLDREQLIAEVSKQLMEWALEARPAYRRDKIALIAMVASAIAAQNVYLDASAVPRLIMDKAGVDRDKAWKILERLERRGLISTDFVSGVPSTITFCLDGGAS